MTEQEVNNLIDSKIAKTKMSQLPEATQISGLYSIGYNGNQSVKYKADLLQGDPLTVRKTYQTEAEALADKNPIDTTTSLPLTVGQFVSIVNDGEKNGIYRIGSISGDGTMSLELQGKLGDLSEYTKTGGSTKTTKDIDDIKANHGYDSNPKTLKEVEDNASVKIKNDAVNGNFENGLIAPFSRTDGGDGASNLVINSSTPISGNYDIRLTVTTPETSLSRPILYGLERAGNIGDKIYLHFYAKILSGVPKIGSIYNGESVTSIYAGDVVNVRNTRVIDVAGTSGSLGLIYFNSESVWDMQMDNFMRINLTETFGAGNEPTEEEMDLLISTLDIDYFEGEITIPSQKIMQWQLKLANTLAQNADDAREAIQDEIVQLADEVEENNHIEIDGTLYQGVPFNSGMSTSLCSDVMLNDGGKIRGKLSDYVNFKFRFIGSDTEDPTTSLPRTQYYQEDKVLDDASVLEKPYVWVQVVRVDGGDLNPADVTLYSRIEVKEKIGEIELSIGDYINLIPDNVFLGGSIDFWSNQPSYANTNVLFERAIFKNPFSQYSLKVTGNYEEPLIPNNAFIGIYQDITSVASEGDILVFRGLVYPTQPNCYLEFRLRDASNASVYQRDRQYFKANQWNEINIEVEIPADTVYANIFVRNLPDGTHAYLAAWDLHKKPNTKIGTKVTLPSKGISPTPVITSRTVYVDSTTGSDSSDGSIDTPFATIGKALTLLSSNYNLSVVVSEGTYRERLALETFTKGHLAIYGKMNETVRILGSNQITGWLLTSGKTNVYETSFAGVINSIKPIIYEDGRQSLPILEGERHALQKSNTHRLPYTKIGQIDFNTDLATTLNDLESSAGNYYHDTVNGKLYIHATDSDNPSTNGYSYEYAVRAGINYPLVGSTSKLKLINLSFYFSNTHGISLTGFGEVERQWVTVMGSVNNGIQDSSTYVISHNDEVADTRDGLAGTNAITGNNRERNNVTYIGAWSHDNSDDGTSHHSKSNVKTIGCLFEYNGKSGIAPSNTSQWTDINSICRKNGGNPSYPEWGEGVEVINPIQPADNGIGCTFTGFGTICEGNRIGFGARRSDTVRVHLYGCVSRNNTDAEYYAEAGKMYANNCKATNADPLKLKVESGTGTITVSNDEQLI